MCTKAEVATVIEHEFFKENGLKDRLNDSFKLQLDAEIGKFTRKQIIAIVIAVFAVAAAWYTLYFQVQQNSTTIKDGFTQSEALIIKAQNEQLSKDISELKADFRLLDQRLRDKGI